MGTVSRDESPASLVARLPEARVGVVGDFCLDAYWILDPEPGAASLETGRPTRPVREQRYSLGGAGNVVANLRAMGTGRVFAFGARGDDPFGAWLARLLGEVEVDGDDLLVIDDARAWQTPVYCKPWEGEDERRRFDLGTHNSLPDSRADEIVARLERALPQLNLVVVNQQLVAGVHTGRLRGRLRELMEAHADTVFLYDGRHPGHDYPQAWLKVNEREALRCTGIEKSADDPISRAEAGEAARRLHDHRSLPVFVTRGAAGCVLVTESGPEEIAALSVPGAVDPVGAGDSFLAGVSAALAVGASPRDAAALGTCVACVTVAKRGQTGTASPEEIIAAGSGPRNVPED